MPHFDAMSEFHLSYTKDHVSVVELQALLKNHVRILLVSYVENFYFDMNDFQVLNVRNQ